MERVTDEWLREADRKAAELADEQYPDDSLFEKWGDACRLAFAQAVALECERICMEVVHADKAAERIRARFGLEDDRG